MSFVGFMQSVSPVTRWWRRSHSITLTLWPMRLAQYLCPHEKRTNFSADGSAWRCEDCFKTHLELD